MRHSSIAAVLVLLAFVFALAPGPATASQITKGCKVNVTASCASCFGTAFGDPGCGCAGWGCAPDPYIACYKQFGTCAKQSDRQCEWAKSPELQACMDKVNKQIRADGASRSHDGCAVSGCNNEVCVDKDTLLIRVCEWKEEYRCTSKATCEKQANGLCGWTHTPTIDACLAKAGKTPPPAKEKKK
jgi:hypothetical protein